MTVDHGLVAYLLCGLLFVLTFDVVGYHHLELMQCSFLWWKGEIPEVEGVPERTWVSQLG